MSNKYNYPEFKKILIDFINDILITFPEKISGLDENLLIIFKSTIKTDVNKEQEQEQEQE